MAAFSHTKKKAGRVKTAALAVFCLAAAAALLLLPAPTLAGAGAGLALCAGVVIPSLFPFMCLSGFVISSGLARRGGRLLEPLMRRVFRLPGATGIVLGLGIIGGYPVGASAAAELCRSGAITKKEAERLLCFCINSGPAFIIGAVGAGMLKSTKAGFLLYAAHIGASLAVGLLLSLCSPRGGERKSRRTSAAELRPAAAFVSSVVQAAQSMLAICAFVVLFAAVLSLLRQTGALPWCAAMLVRVFPSIGEPFFGSLLTGVFEVTNGCAAAVSPGPANLYLISAILSWSGLSVQFQVMSAVGGAGLSTVRFVLTRPLHIVFSLLLTALLFRLFPVALPVFAQGAVALVPAFHTAPASAALFFLCGILLLSLAHL